MKNGRIKQSIVYWCFEKYWDMDQATKVAKQLGCDSIELMAPKFFPLLKQSGLKCAIGTIDMSPDPPFVKGFNNPKYRERVLKATREVHRRLRRLRVQEGDLLHRACARASPTTWAPTTASRASRRSSATPRRRA